LLNYFQKREAEVFRSINHAKSLLNRTHSKRRPIYGRKKFQFDKMRFSFGNAWVFFVIEFLLLVFGCEDFGFDVLEVQYLIFVA
jgi:hypothetical protein